MTGKSVLQVSSICLLIYFTKASDPFPSGSKSNSTQNSCRGPEGKQPRKEILGDPSSLKWHPRVAVGQVWCTVDAQYVSEMHDSLFTDICQLWHLGLDLIPCGQKVLE